MLLGIAPRAWSFTYAVVGDSRCGVSVHHEPGRGDAQHWQTPFQWAAPSIIKFVSLKPTARCSRSNVSNGRTKRAEKESGSHHEEKGRPAETAPKETNRVTC